MMNRDDNRRGRGGRLGRAGHVARGARRIVLLSGLLSSAFAARAIDATYELRDLHFVGPAGQNGLPVAVDVMEPGVAGHFVWTYQAGDFANGTGTLLDITLPIASQPLSALTTTVDLAGLTGTYAGNTQNLTLDFSIRFLPALSAPGVATGIDSASSTFDFTGSYLGSSPFVEWTGHVVSGTVVPVPEPAAATMMLAGLLLMAGRKFSVDRSTARGHRPR